MEVRKEGVIKAAAAREVARVEAAMVAVEKVGATAEVRVGQEATAVEEKVEEVHRLDSLILLMFTCLLSLTVVTIWLFKHRRIRYLHETGLALVYGLVIGAVIRYGVSDRVVEVSHYAVNFRIILPPTIYISLMHFFWASNDSLLVYIYSCKLQSTSIQ